MATTNDGWTTPIAGSQLRVLGRTGIGVALLEQTCEVGVTVPPHTHPYGEVLHVAAGAADVLLGDERQTVTAGDTIFIPTGVTHGFTATGAQTLQLRCAIGGDDLVSDLGGLYWPAYPLGGAVYAERDGKILILLRAGGEGAGLWALPMGAIEQEETPEEGALRELREETGLVPTGPVALVNLFPRYVYGRDIYVASYTCECAEGDVVLDAEHSSHLWIDPGEYRQQIKAFLSAVPEDNTSLTTLISGALADVDRYLAWREMS